MDLSALFAKIDEKKDEYLNIWIDSVRLESPTHDKARVDALGNYFKEYASARGWEIKVYPEERAGDVISITMNKDAKEAPFALSGHMDTVHEVGAFGRDVVRVEDGKIYGPGVTDCKGGIIAGLLAMDALRECGFTSRPVVMYLQSDEEGGGKFSNDTTINNVCAAAQGSRAFLNLEGMKKGCATIARKGIATFEFTVHGREAHSARCAVEGANAIHEAAHKIIEIEKYKDHEGLTASCNVISGGTVHNTVAGECRFVANVRFATMAQLEEFKKFAERLSKEVTVPGCSTEVVLPRVRPAMEMDEKNRSLLCHLNGIWAKSGLGELKPNAVVGGSDGANVSAAGIPTVDSLGVLGGKVHTLLEYAEIDSLAEQAKRIASAIACI